MSSYALANVIRISGSGVASATFKDFAPGALEWARLNRMDRIDYDFYPFSESPTSKEISDTLSQLIRQFPREGILVVGIPGPIEKGKIVICPSLPDLITVLPDVLNDQWPENVALANNTDLFAEAELRQGIFRSFDWSSGIIITLGRGIGSAIVRNGQVDLDSKLSGGEIGHTRVDANGPICECGHRGCFEQYISGPALVRIATEKGIQVQEALELAELDSAQLMLEEAREILVDRLSFAVTLLRTRIIVFGGRLSSLYGIQKIQDMLNEHIPHFVKNDQGVKVYASNFTSSQGTLLGGGYVGLRLQGAEPAYLATNSP